MKKFTHIFVRDLQAYRNNGIRSFIFIFSICVFVGTCIGIRYLFYPEFYRSQADHPELFSILFYPTAYFSTIALIVIFFRKKQALSDPEFWLISFIILLVLYFNHFHSFFPSGNFPYYMYSFLHGISYNIQCTILYALPPIILWFLYYKKKEVNWKVFGLNSSKADLRPYFGLLFCMLPLLLWASFRDDFQATYPRYIPGELEKTLHVSPFLTTTAFELSYVTQFITLEWFFRGFMVLSLSRFFGAQAVWLMVSVYVFLHFEKPLHGTIGSFFGAYILGTIAYYTESILGGMVVHVGIALFMELFATLW